MYSHEALKTKEKGKRASQKDLKHEKSFMCCSWLEDEGAIWKATKGLILAMISYLCRGPGGPVENCILDNTLISIH